MKNYIPLLVGLACAGMHAADRPNKIYHYPMRIQYADGNVENIKIPVTLQTRLWDLQEVLRRKFGSGNLMFVSSPIDNIDLMLLQSSIDDFKSVTPQISDLLWFNIE